MYGSTFIKSNIAEFKHFKYLSYLYEDGQNCSMLCLD